MELLTLALVVFTTLILLHVKHFLCDFVYQTKYMLTKDRKHKWLGPLTCHAGVHALGTLVVLAIPATMFGVYFPLLVICVVEGLVHCLIDGIKCRCFRYNVFSKRYWVALGFDQLLHSLTYVAIAATLWYLTIKA